MKEIVQQLSMVLDLPLASFGEQKLLSECVRKIECQTTGVGDDYEAYEQLLQLEEREVSLLCYVKS